MKRRTLTGRELRDPEALAANVLYWTEAGPEPDPLWYDQAHALAQALAWTNGARLDVTAYALAVASVGNRWPRNVADVAATLASPDGGHTLCTYGRFAQLCRDVAAGRIAPDPEALGPKTRPFFEHILAPPGQRAHLDPVIDRHSWSLSAGLPPEDRTSALSLTDARRLAAQEAHRLAAARLDVTASRVQAWTWTNYRTAAGIAA